MIIISNILILIFQGQNFQLKKLIISHDDLSPWFKLLRGQYFISYTIYDDLDKSIFYVSGHGRL